MQTVDRQTFINAMRNVASSVSVVTTDGPAGRHGATVSAFCSVSADPPTILVCLNTRSRIAGYVAENGVFQLNVLPDGAEDIAARFAGQHDDAVTDRFDGIDHSGALPGFAGATALRCTLTQSVTEGTHLICFGRVAEVTMGAGPPLTYYAGQYRSVAEKEAEE